jgi:hypothetical protein
VALSTRSRGLELGARSVVARGNGVRHTRNIRLRNRSPRRNEVNQKNEKSRSKTCGAKKRVFQETVQPTALFRKDASAKVREGYPPWRRTKRPRFPSVSLCLSGENQCHDPLFPQLRHRLLHPVCVGFIGFELQVRFVALASIGIFAQLLLRLCQSDPRRARIGFQFGRFP